MLHASIFETLSSKGQLISEDFFLVFDFTKNERKTSALVARAKFCKHFVCFFEELRTRKNDFEII